MSYQFAKHPKMSGERDSIKMISRSDTQCSTNPPESIDLARPRQGQNDHCPEVSLTGVIRLAWIQVCFRATCAILAVFIICVIFPALNVYKNSELQGSGKASLGFAGLVIACVAVYDPINATLVFVWEKLTK